MSREMEFNSGPLQEREIAIVGAVACGLASVRVMANPGIRRPVAQFIYFYQQTGDMNLWERVIYSLLLAETTGPSSSAAAL